MRPIKSKTIILAGPPGIDDGDPHLNPEAAPACVASEEFWTPSPADRLLIAAGGVFRLRMRGGRLSVDVARPDEVS